MPSLKELQDAKDAEAVAISKKIEEGYDYKEELENSRKLFKAWLGDDYSSEAMERNRQRMKAEKKERK